MSTRILLNLAVVAAALGAGAMAMFGQWPGYPTGGPRLPDGKVDFKAAPPRTPDGKIDFTGLWEPAAGKGMNGMPALTFEIPKGPDDPPNASFANIGAGLKGGTPYTAWAKEEHDERKGNNSKDNPDALCLPLGLTQLHTHPQPRKVVQTRREIVVLYEANGNVRQILTDGRKLPASDLSPWWYGYSVGHWEEDELVVETTGFRDDVWLDVEGSPLTNTGKMTERWRRPYYGVMQVDITIEDPKSYIKPFTVRVNHRLMPDTELMEFVCEERDATHYVGKTGK